MRQLVLAVLVFLAAPAPADAAERLSKRARAFCTFSTATRIREMPPPRPELP